MIPLRFIIRRWYIEDSAQKTPGISVHLCPDFKSATLAKRFLTVVQSFLRVRKNIISLSLVTASRSALASPARAGVAKQSPVW